MNNMNTNVQYRRARFPSYQYCYLYVAIVMYLPVESKSFYTSGFLLCRKRYKPTNSSKQRVLNGKNEHKALYPKQLGLLVVSIGINVTAASGIRQPQRLRKLVPFCLSVLFFLLKIQDQVVMIRIRGLVH